MNKRIGPHLAKRDLLPRLSVSGMCVRACLVYFWSARPLFFRFPSRSSYCIWHVNRHKKRNAVAQLEMPPEAIGIFSL